MKTCQNCRHWGHGDGTGMSYDAGTMNFCFHDQIHGKQHPTKGNCGEPITMLYAGSEKQLIMTRWNFGCVLCDTY